MDKKTFTAIYYQMKNNGIYNINPDNIRDFFDFIITKLEKYQSEEIVNSIDHLLNDKRYCDDFNLVTSEFENDDIPILLGELNFNFIDGKLEYISLSITIDLVSLFSSEESDVLIHINPQICGFEDSEFLELDKEKIKYYENYLISKTLNYIRKV